MKCDHIKWLSHKGNIGRSSQCNLRIGLRIHQWHKYLGNLCIHVQKKKKKTYMMQSVSSVNSNFCFPEKNYYLLSRLPLKIMGPQQVRWTCNIPIGSSDSCGGRSLSEPLPTFCCVRCASTTLHGTYSTSRLNLGHPDRPDPGSTACTTLSAGPACFFHQ